MTPALFIGTSTALVMFSSSVAACPTFFCEGRSRKRTRVFTEGKSIPTCLDAASALPVDPAVRTSSDGPLDAIARAIASLRPDAGDDDCIRSVS